MATLSKMLTPEAWEDRDDRNAFLAKQLSKGRLALVLGAGASFGFGLPNWTKLAKALFADENKRRANAAKGVKGVKVAKLVRPLGLKTDEAACSWFRTQVLESHEEFARRVQRLLFHSFDSSIDALRHNDLLAAITALVISSRRGKVSRVVSFNFDDLVELYLRFFGMTVSCAVVQPAWASTSDVEVLHPHGLLTADGSIATRIVFTEDDFDAVHAGEHASWDSTLHSILSANTCIFVGLSGADPRLRAALKRAQPSHVSSDDHMYWGVRYTVPPDDRMDKWETAGVYQVKLGNYDEVPSELLDICKRAAAQGPLLPPS